MKWFLIKNFVTGFQLRSIPDYRLQQIAQNVLGFAGMNHQLGGSTGIFPLSASTINCCRGHWTGEGQAPLSGIHWHCCLDLNKRKLTMKLLDERRFQYLKKRKIQDFDLGKVLKKQFSDFWSGKIGVFR